MDASANAAATPGQLIQRHLEARGWTQRTLSAVLDVGELSITRVLNGKQAVDAELAVAIEQVLGVPADQLLLLQANGDLACARATHRPDPRRALRARLYGDLPLREMIRRGWLDIDDIRDVAQVDAALLGLFGVREIEDIGQVAQAGDDGPASLRRAAWLARVRQLAQQTGVASRSAPEPELVLSDLRKLLRDAESIADVPRVLSSRGIRLAIVEALPGAPIDMACLWLDRFTPVIGLSLRDDRIDRFWLLLRHALEHVLRRTDCVRSEGDGDTGIAEEFCVPSSALDTFIARRAPFIAKRDLVAFAGELDIHPGILAGRLQSRTGKYEHLSSCRISVRPIIQGHAMCDGWASRVQPRGRVAPKQTLLPENVVTPA